jgi:hypothetical protein
VALTVEQRTKREREREREKEKEELHAIAMKSRVDRGKLNWVSGFADSHIDPNAVKCSALKYRPMSAEQGKWQI